MTLRCPSCESSYVDLVGSNEAKYPETRVEHFACPDCGYEFTEVLTA